ncbi:MAG: hypothetical protein JXB39_07215 [Deltaproteobacteria bacterium]|nr:hypothetical protein [Deltaproteobacteria bacterium]
MLSWTAKGAVQMPETVQIRVQRSYPGRIRAGAPVPTRSMSEEEVLDNVRWFTEGERGPRGVPSTGLVLSGVGVVSRPDSPRVLAAARLLGIRRVVLHVGGEDLESFRADPWHALVDVLVVPVQPVEVEGGLEAGARAVRSCREAGVRVAVNTVLDARAVDRLAAVARSVVRMQPDEVTFTYPFPIHGSQGAAPPPIARTVTLLGQAIRVLEAGGIQPRVKGLPACYLGEYAKCLGPSQNRWYVDADHQKDGALLFFPDVVSFHKEEVCRFCRLDDTCDGFFATYLRRSGFPPLDPLPLEGVT